MNATVVPNSDDDDGGESVDTGGTKADTNGRRRTSGSGTSIGHRRDGTMFFAVSIGPSLRCHMRREKN